MLAPADIQALRDQIAAIERETTGEVAVVVLEESDAHPQGAMLAALVGAIAAATIASSDPRTAHAAVLLPALALGAAAGYVLSRALPHFRRRFVSTRRADEMVEEQALQEFSRLGMHRTEGRTGVLILVSLFERAAIVLADDGVDSKVGPDAWVDADRRILEGVRAGSLARGLRDGVEAVGEVLRAHCARSGPPRSEVPDHVIVRRR
jgi:putative membrane protein